MIEFALMSILQSERFLKSRQIFSAHYILPDEIDTSRQMTAKVNIINIIVIKDPIVKQENLSLIIYQILKLYVVECLLSAEVKCNQLEKLEAAKVA